MSVYSSFAKLAKNYQLDLRSLALFRIALGVIILADIAIRIGSYELFYGVESIASKGSIGTAAPLHRNLLTDFAELEFLAPAAFLLLATSAVCLIVGFRPQIAAGAGWILISSINSYNPLILHTADRLFPILLFWAALLPIGKTWTVGQNRLSTCFTKSETGYFSLATVGLQLQAFFLYQSAFLYKIAQPTWRNGEHLDLTLRRSEFLDYFGVWIRPYDAFNPVFTWLVLAIQFVAPLLLLANRKWWRCRVTGVALLIALQAGMGLVLHLGLFPWVSIAATLPLIPPEFWTKLRSKWASGTATAKNDHATQPLRSRSFRTIALHGLAAFALTILLLNNYKDHSGALENFRPLESATKTLGFKQEWKMFSKPVYTYGWYLMVAEYDDGRELDLFNDAKPLNFDEPRYARTRFANYRVRILLTSNLRYPKYANHYDTFLATYHRTRSTDSDLSGLNNLSLLEVKKSLFSQSGTTVTKIVNHASLHPARSKTWNFEPKETQTTVELASRRSR